MTSLSTPSLVPSTSPTFQHHLPCPTSTGRNYLQLLLTRKQQLMLLLQRKITKLRKFLIIGGTSSLMSIRQPILLPNQKEKFRISSRMFTSWNGCEILMNQSTVLRKEE